MSKLNLVGIGMTSQRTRERLIGRLMDQGISDLRVIDVMRTTPRHIFLDEALAHKAYEDVALPIGYNQTISQPYIVAKMTQAALAGSELENVLEVGTGCGYQTAVIAQLATRIFTIERLKPLYDKARKNIRAMGLKNIVFRLGDGSEGWEDHAPFDAIIAAAAPQSVPQKLLQQLADGGRLVIPVGGDEFQELKVITRQGDEFTTTVIESVRFVPLLVGQTQS